MILTSEVISAKEAFALGLATRIFSAATLRENAIAYAEESVRVDRSARRAAKSVLAEQTPQSLLQLEIEACVSHAKTGAVARAIALLRGTQ